MPLTMMKDKIVISYKQIRPNIKTLKVFLKVATTLNLSTKMIKKPNVIFLVLVNILSAVIFSSSFASENNGTTFEWRPNPSNEKIIGYRLYYGNTSRYNSKGNLKSKFKYDSYIDFSSGKLCAGNNFKKCKDMTSSDFKCSKDITGKTKCTIFNIKGNKYFSLTAYNFIKESNYSKEIFLVQFNIQPITELLFSDI